MLLIRFFPGTFLSTLSLRRATIILTALLTPLIRFLSTLSLRRATVFAQLVSGGALYFYPRSPCGERPYYQDKFSIPSDISIHALLAESDIAVQFVGSALAPISIHALLAESDAALCEALPPKLHFYPRSPCGERLASLT